ncbi:MAG: ABC transporter substrate-binding protein [Neptuniibacter sp.]
MKKINKSVLSAVVSGAIAATLVSPAMAATDGKVKLGILADMGGTYADICGPGCVTAAKMAVEDFGGKVLGNDIEVISADSQLKPDIASSIARKWVEDEGVDTIGGLVSSAVSGAVSKVNADNKKITLISGSASNAFTTKSCNPYNVHWTYNVVALANGTVKPMVQSGKKKWFFITADYSFGHALEGVASKVIKTNGGEVVGNVRAPLGTTDFSSYILQAQASGADVVALANAGNDTVNALKAATEFGLTEQMDVAGLLVFTQNAQAMDPAVAAGMRLTTGFYWDLDDKARDWGKRFEARHGNIPSMIHAGVYSATMHYLNAVKTVGTDDSDAVMKQMKQSKPDDFFSRNAELRPDGRMVHDMLYVEIKKQAERKSKSDIYKVIKVIPGADAYNPMQPQCNFS